jgi:hypothetical protein
MNYLRIMLRIYIIFLFDYLRGDRPAANLIVPVARRSECYPISHQMKLLSQKENTARHRPIGPFSN